VRTRPPVCAGTEALEDWNKETAGLGVSTRLYSLAAVAQGTRQSNPEVFPGDIINVPEASPVYIDGEVRTPGPIGLPSSGLSLLQAIAMANGNTTDAKLKDIKVYRKKQGSPDRDVLVADLIAIEKGTQKDIMLEPFDIVQVGKKGETFSSFWMKILTGLPQRIPIPIP